MLLKLQKSLKKADLLFKWWKVNADSLQSHLVDGFIGRRQIIYEH